VELRDVVLIVLGYLCGSLPMGVIVARATGARDPRTVGSGKIGGTNALRAMGQRRAILTAILDISKGFVPVLLARQAGAAELVQALVGAAAVLGSCRSVFLRFHGGRGLSAGIGALLAIAPLAVLVTAPVFFLVIRVSRYVALGSLAAALAAAVVLAAFAAAGWTSPMWLVYGFLAAGLIWLAHADNIGRMLRGEERRFSYRERERS
jgi:glycerol-3-phosphate acyltransferase PlsY